MRTAIIGGGAAGFFLAINLKEMCPQMHVTIYERSQHLLRKVKVSGGGRCNCTNTFEDVRDLSAVYPRGHRLMKRLLKGFSQRDAYAWFERHGVPLTVQPDHCVFPAAQDSQVIIDCFLHHARRLGIEIRTSTPVTSINLNDNTNLKPNLNDNLNERQERGLGGESFIVVTTGGQPSMSGLRWLADLGHEIEPPVPSLFTFSIEDPALRALMGTVVEGATAAIPGTKFRATGPLLITHWGVSGPAILKLSSYAARYLADHDYHAPLIINWTGMNEEQVRAELQALLAANPHKQLTSLHPFGLPTRLWHHLLSKANSQNPTPNSQSPTPNPQHPTPNPQHPTPNPQHPIANPQHPTANAQHPARPKDASTLRRTPKTLSRLVALLTADPYTITSRAPFKDEFVTCGGISLSAVNPSTLESRHCPHLYFAGELLDIDGITGGFNFQAAWTTAHTVAHAIAATLK